MTQALAAMNDASWYLIHTKPKQEFRALEQLENQGYVCYLPTLEVEKLVRGKRALCVEALFSRYLFIRLSKSTGNWSPIRSTRGVSNLVSFGREFAVLPEECIESLQSMPHRGSRQIYAPGDRVEVMDGPFAGLEGVYQMADGEARAMILVELMSRPQKIAFALESLRKAA